MKQVTYEKVNKSIERLINIVQIVDEHDLEELGFEYSNEEFQNDLANTRDFIEQHKPPTWGEIVLIWDKLGYDNVNISEHYKMIFLEGYGKNLLFISLKDGIESNDDVYVDITVDMLNAINLTIRYLEAQENVDENN
ncbi:hypothetical protein [Erysipelothrix anatis]|uniref:hypothetical protein n=1 Tax=Erysipelothrix anatis TaxID=2683713 RepID=UPI0013597FF2|nr:hypothetical protein [Erysipelothrix anatis]